ILSELVKLSRRREVNPLGALIRDLPIAHPSGFPSIRQRPHTSCSLLVAGIGDPGRRLNLSQRNRHQRCRLQGSVVAERSRYEGTTSVSSPKIFRRTEPACAKPPARQAPPVPPVPRARALPRTVVAGVPPAKI